jgi:hypothetical protein
MKDLLVPYALGFLIGIGAAILLLFLGMADDTPVWFYYVLYPIILGGTAAAMANRKPRGSFHWGIAVSIPITAFWSFFIIFNMQWNANKIAPMILSVASAMFLSFYFARARMRKNETLMSGPTPPAA